MESWFGATSTHYFNLFSTSHLIVLTIALIGTILLFLFKNKLRDSSKGSNWLRWILLALLVLSEFSFHYWAIVNDVWRFHNQMPFHLCGVASVVSIIGLITMRPFWIQLAFFIGILPAFLALFTPELPYDYQHFRFWKFFIHHMAITWACLFLALSRPQVITIRSFFGVYSLLLVYAALVGFFINPWTDSNFLFLMQRPTTTSPLDFFGEGIWYYINLCLTTFALFFIQYVLFHKFVKRS